MAVVPPIVLDEAPVKMTVTVRKGRKVKWKERTSFAFAAGSEGLGYFLTGRVLSEFDSHCGGRCVEVNIYESVGEMLPV